MRNDTPEPQGIKSTVIPFSENRFKPRPVKETPRDENLIDFKQPNRWMHGVEGNKNPINFNGFNLFAALCLVAAIYFIFR